MFRNEAERLDPRQEEVAASQRLGQILQGHLTATRQCRDGERLVGPLGRPHDRIILVVKGAEAEVAHPSLVNELELSLEIGIARDEEYALPGLAVVFGLFEIGASTAK